MKGTVGVVGAGWAGLTAALELARDGCRVLVFEANAMPGGRARRVEIDGRPLDNGQHLFIGAYTDTLAAIRLAGIDPAAVFQRMPLSVHMQGSPGLHLALSPRLAGHPRLALGRALLQLSVLPLRERLTALLGARGLLQPAAADETVRDWLQRHRQPPLLCTHLWEPLCLAALNTPAISASARVFSRVLRDTFSSPGGTDLLLPRVDLGQLFPDPACAQIRSLGGEVHLQTRIRQIAPTRAGNWLLETADARYSVDHIVLATDAAATARLLPEQIPLHPLRQRLHRLAHEPITTVWLQFPRPPTLPHPMTGRLDGPAQWLFDRSLTDQPGLLAAVISGPGPHQDSTRDALFDAILQQLADLSRTAGIPTPVAMIREKRATFRCSPATEALRIPLQGPLRGLWFAGDHAANGLPATIEGAVRNGRSVAAQIRDDMTAPMAAESGLRPCQPPINAEVNP